MAIFKVSPRKEGEDLVLPLQIKASEAMKGAIGGIFGHKKSNFLTIRVT